MSLKKYRGLNALGLGIILAALSLMVFSASAAQAVWLKNGATITGLENFVAEVDLLMTLEVPTLSTELDCATFSVKKGEILGSAEVTEPNVGHLEFLYEKCDAYGTTPTLALDNGGLCELYETVADRTAKTNEGNIVAKALLSVVSHGGKQYLLVKSISAQIFSRECVGVPNGTTITGEVTLDLHEGPGTNRVKQLVSVANLTLFPNQLKFGVNAMLLLGSIWVKLASGNPWGIC
jgi:hypothetical protein